jgi:hypothetical protein
MGEVPLYPAKQHTWDGQQGRAARCEEFHLEKKCFRVAVKCRARADLLDLMWQGVIVSFLKGQSNEIWIRT